MADRRRTWRTWQLAAVAALALAACSGSVDEGERVETGDPPAAVDPGQGGTAAPTAAPTAPSTSPPARANAVGDKVSLANGDTIQVYSYTPNVPASNQFATPDPGHAFAVIDVEGCARAANPTGVVNPFAFELQMPDNTRLTPTFLPVKSPELRSGAQAAGDCIRGNVAFEVPTSAKPVAVVFSTFATSVKWNIP